MATRVTGLSIIKSSRAPERSCGHGTCVDWRKDWRERGLNRMVDASAPRLQHRGLQGRVLPPLFAPQAVATINAAS
jgi:hypothetical protein